MELALQYGSGMMDHSRVLVDSWGGGTVILSPRDLDPTQLTRHAETITSISGGDVFLDPQFYLPDADHARLTSHDFWPSSYASGTFWSGAELRTLVQKLLARNVALECSAMILPGLYAERVDTDWLDRQARIVEQGQRSADGFPLLATVALGAEAVGNNTDIDDVLAAADHWDVWGVYLVCEHPRGEYLVKDPTWMTNVLDLVAGLRLKRKQVYVGYSNHQMLALGCASVNAIASGTWMNVRSFPPEKFRTEYDDEIKQRSVWYYAPGPLSEYKLATLDIAQKQGVLDLLRPDSSLRSDYAAPLFSGVQPTSVGWGEQAAFRHYLQLLHGQVGLARLSTFDDTVTAHEKMLDTAETVLSTLHSETIRGQFRDFKECIDVTRSAIAVLRSSRGGVLRREWSSLE